MPEMKFENPGHDRALVRKKIATLEQELAAWKKLDEQLQAIDKGEGTSLDFVGMAPYEAICEFLKIMGKPQTRDGIIHAVIEGRARLGQVKEKSINQSISTNVGLKKLKEMNDLVGLTEWPDSVFK
jgi:hypothetical protein